MVGYMPKEVRDGLDAARKQKARTRRRMKIQVGGESFAILRYWDTGFAVEADTAPIQRGLADLYEEERLVANCLIVASAEEAGETVYEFKRNTRALDRPPADFVRDEEAPAGYLSAPT